MGLLESIEERAFLGEEFLTWLLWRSESRNGVIGVNDMEVHFGGAIVLTAPFGDAEEVALKGDNPAEARELYAALGEGKLIARAQTRWVIDGIEWLCAIRGATLTLGGLKPPLKSAPPDAEWIERRLELLGEFCARFDQALEAFLAVRLSDASWKRETKALREWAACGVDEGSASPDLIELTDDSDET